MITPSSLFAFGVLSSVALAQTSSFTFTAPASSPTDTSSFYVGPSNGTLPKSKTVPGCVFDRFIQIWLENTDFATAAASSVYQELSAQGITLTGYYALTHPSEPNYLASVGGDFWGLASDDFVTIPANISTVVDLLELEGISWAEYMENMPTDGYQGYNYTNSDGYTYYVRKHNPLIVYDSVSQNPGRAARIRNFNDFAYDVGNNTLPQWFFVTPNMKDDGHDTDINYQAQWLNYWLLPLLKNSNFNTEKTLILLTFDETELYTINNNVYSILLGGAIPDHLKGTTDDTFYTHYSTITTIQNNWKLRNLGRHDCNKTLSNVFKVVADQTGYKNNGLTNSSTLPLLNITGTIPGPLNPQYWAPWRAPDITCVGAGEGPTYVSPGTN
ncbi:hypothetical protein SCLCIDRAFT_22508 [Scleroderma citrinum Foug A]|uniref:Acid phosphatase n=1 Tax=Scleroderma citrinum Foug A TaxID=1036808 RepID=A0A0C3AL12_9AGAM|nr:hypothetical protein SCLCIDRAFT_22508 [Scleroderma citrinum Foug A]